MKKEKLMNLANTYNMKPMYLTDESKECYGETVVVTSHQVGYMVESKELIPELDILADDLSYTLTPVIREYQPWDDNYCYKVYAPDNWFLNM